MSLRANSSRLATALAAFHMLACLFLLAQGSALGAGGDAALRRALSGLVHRGGVAVAEAGGVTFAHAPGSYIPASIIKLATALAAFHLLGPGYRFKTEIYLDARRNLIVRGYGDPYLVSEEWMLIASELVRTGVFAKPLNDLILDESAFSGDVEVHGAANSDNPYDARLGALVSNFNTIFVKVRPGGTLASAEPQTPLTPLARRLAAGLPPGRHRINFSQTPGDSLRYSGELAREFLERAGARFKGRVRAGMAPKGLAPLWVHRASRSLEEVVRAMMEFSNNYIANQIVMAIGLKQRGEPAGLARGIAELSAYLRKEMGLEADDFQLVEGSGLSPRNRITLLAMLRIVEAFRPWRRLLRRYGKPPRQSLAKTGTLTGVYTLAGFLPAPGGGELPFVIMLNQVRNTRTQVYRRLFRHYGRKGAANEHKKSRG